MIEDIHTALNVLLAVLLAGSIVALGMIIQGVWGLWRAWRRR